MDSKTIQYVIIAVILISSVYSLFRILKKNFSPKKFDSKRSNCDKDCGCS